ncbi:hypothetical protein NIES22_73880 (plasmid) [Calothrix brevissima NIES-22]|nr:hypothetical protein NIES22_73880 [Calothrix brevissima NIES-22]
MSDSDYSDYPVYKITVVYDDELENRPDDEIYIAYVDGDLLDCITAMNLSEDSETMAEKLIHRPQKVDWYLSPAGVIYLGD